MILSTGLVKALLDKRWKLVTIAHSVTTEGKDHE